MRLFVAAHFPEAANLRFLEFVDVLQKNAKGSFTKPQNLHMTVIFIGDIKPAAAEKIKEIMKKTIQNAPVNMKFTGAGQFKSGHRKDEALIWVGGESAELSEIHRHLFAALQNAGIETDRKKFVPHVTLGRRILFKKEKDACLKSMDAAFETSVSRISLMESELTPEGPVYKELFLIDL
ncbi:MAG: RNA 2',3'-cyclic phosphodiesterase [Methanosarcinales archaeon]|nr:RNA 2',3'-cyclic phosphodiesterase [Methanosarcinales archaeon]